MAIGGVGGSGTRLVAEVVRSLGVHLGCDLNRANDTLWFTLLFKRIEILQCGEEEFDLLTDALTAGLQGGRPLHPDARSLVAACSDIDRQQHYAAWLRERVDSLLAAASDPPHHGRWGWKEPNTHVVIERLWQRLPDLRYIHVVRHGLDMAHSRNQNQLSLWGHRALGEDGPVTPQRSLAYWCHVHQRMQALRSDNGDRLYLLDYDAFCRQPERQAVPLLQFLGFPQRKMPDLSSMIAPRRPKVWEPLDTFPPRQLEYVRSLGYDITSLGAWS